MDKIATLLQSQATKIINEHPDTTEVKGSGFPDVDASATVIRCVKIPTEDGRVELGITTPDAHPAFTWLVEITVINPQGSWHYLIYSDGLVEANGRVLTPVTPEDATALLDTINSL